MKLTIAIKKQLCENLLRVSPLYQKAKDTVQARADLVELIRLACLKQMGTSDEELDALVKEVAAIKKVDCFATPYVETNKTSKDSARHVKVAINGMDLYLSTVGIDRFYHSEFGGCYISDNEIFGKEIKPESKPGKFCPTDRIYLSDANAQDFKDALLANDSEIITLIDELVAFRLEVMGALQQIKTDKQLQEHWPDAVQYLPEIQKDPASTQVALSVETLNAICGIPK